MNTIPIPENLPLLIGRLDEEKGKALTTIFSGDQNLHQIFMILGKICKIKIWWSEPVTVYSISRWSRWKLNEKGQETRTKSSGTKEGTEHVFNGFFLNNDSLCYKFKKNGCEGYYLPSIDKIIKYEPVIENFKENKFDSYEQFKAKFDPQFITEDFIKQLYSEKSAQTGKRYTPADFKRIDPRGKEALRRFMTFFQGVSNTNTTTPGYIERGEEGKRYHYLDARYYSSGHPGRDITIGHTLGLNRVSYSSEFHNCGNGTYGLLANKNEYLWLEND